MSDGESRVCQCGHSLHVHTHYRSGSDCSLCACDRFVSFMFAALLWLLVGVIIVVAFALTVRVLW
jgi:hypothetical protein